VSVYYPYLSDHSLPKSKRQQIRDLILSKAKTEDIVDQVNTTKEYVYKERGKLKQEGLLVTHQSLSVSNGQRETTVVKNNANDSVQVAGRMTINRINEYDIPPPDSKAHANV
jgi:hypothetical protein